MFRESLRSRAIHALLLLFVSVTLAVGCGTVGVSDDSGNSGNAGGGGNSGSSGNTAEVPEAPENAQGNSNQSANEMREKESGGDEVQSITPEDILSEEELAEGAPETRDWNAPTDAEVVSLPGTEGTSAGAIPAVKPFNFGRDPGGPEDKTMYLTIPKIGLTDVPVLNELSEEALTESTVHHPGTGFPWQAGANTFIAGHRIGYEGTGSNEIFYDVPDLVAGDEIIVTDSEGGEYVYQVTDQETVGIDNVASMNPVDGKSMISLQTCTLPDYAERIIVHGELVEGDAV